MSSRILRRAFLYGVPAGTAYILYVRKTEELKKRRAIVPYRRVVNTLTEAKGAGKVNAVVLGGSGSLGKYIIKYLLEDGGYQVHSLDLRIPEEGSRNDGVSSYIQTDITNGEDVVKALKGMDTVFHTASIIPLLGFADEDYYRINTGGTENVLNACLQSGVERLIYTSSTFVIISSDPSQVVDGADESWPYPTNPLNAYSGSKAAAEKKVRASNGKNDLLTCALRPGGILSADNASQLIPLQGRIGIPGDGLFQVSMVPVEAAARGHILAEKKLRKDGAASVAAGKVYNLVLDDKVAFRDYVGYGKETGTTIWGHKPPYHVPRWLAFTGAYAHSILYYLTGNAPLSRLYAPMGVGSTGMEQTFTSALAHKELGWEELPPWQDVVRKVVKDYKEQKQKAARS